MPVPLPTAAATDGAAVAPVASPCSSRSPPWSEPSAVMSLPVADAAAQGDGHGPASSSTVARAVARPGRRRRRASASVSRSTPARWAATAGASPSTHSSIRSSSSSPASRRRSWIGALQLARVALGAQLGVSSVSMTIDQAVVVGDGRAGPGRGLDLDLVGGQGHAGERHRAVRVELDVPSRAAAITAGIARPEPLADLRQQRLDAPLDQVGVVGDDLDLP